MSITVCMQKSGVQDGNVAFLCCLLTEQHAHITGPVHIVCGACCCWGGGSGGVARIPALAKLAAAKHQRGNRSWMQCMPILYKNVSSAQPCKACLLACCYVCQQLHVLTHLIAALSNGQKARAKSSIQSPQHTEEPRLPSLCCPKQHKTAK
jgi:hypothetical protein